MPRFTKEEQVKLQMYLRMIYPDVDNFLTNTMTPAIVHLPDKDIVTMLIIGDRNRLKPLLKDRSESMDIETACDSEPNEKGTGQDLVIGMRILCPKGSVTMESVICGDKKQAQQRLAQTLKTIDEVTIWVVNENHEFVRIMNMSWLYEPHQEVLDQFL
ncbi:MAG: hypothetical protein U9N81_08665 [Bacillota bacterium]|nr:hypothetical protein [Bacillota bacterium]